MTHAENERLAIVETEVKNIANDLSEVKKDVKSLLALRDGMGGLGNVINRIAPWAAVGVAIIALGRSI